MAWPPIKGARQSHPSWRNSGTCKNSSNSWGVVGKSSISPSQSTFRSWAEVTCWTTATSCLLLWRNLSKHDSRQPDLTVCKTSLTSPLGSFKLTTRLSCFQVQCAVSVQWWSDIHFLRVATGAPASLCQRKGPSFNSCMTTRTRLHPAMQSKWFLAP